jgi:hypothetical protein
MNKCLRYRVLYSCKMDIKNRAKVSVMFPCTGDTGLTQIPKQALLGLVSQGAAFQALRGLDTGSQR